MADKNTPVVAFVGLGSMGLGMAKNLLKHGHKVIGVDPSAPAREAFAAAGGTIAATPGEAAAAADALVVAVVNAQQVETVLYGEGGGVAKLRKGGLVMQCATVPAAFAKSLGERLAKSGHELLDAPMSGGRARAESGELTFMASGSAKAFAAAELILSATSAKVFRLGDAAGHRLAGQDREPASGRRAHRDGGRGDGARRQGRRRHARRLRGDLGQRRQFLDVRQSRAAHARRRLLAACPPWRSS